MSNFLVKLLGNQVEKDLAEQPGKNPVKAILQNPMVKSMLKTYRKELTEAITKGEQDLIRTIEKIELQPGENQAAPVLDIDTNAAGEKELRLLIVCFDENQTITRMISDTPLREFLIKNLHETIK